MAGKQKHGGCDLSEYAVWRDMRHRCSNPKIRNFSRYGGRGIKVCDRWNDFSLFLADMGPRPSPKHSIDRENNDGNYEPGNCRWATRKVQNRNRINNRRIEFRGETKILLDWAKELGLSFGCLHGRIDRGWTIEQALTEPANRHPSRPRRKMQK